MTDHVVSRTGDGLMLKQYRPNAGDLPRREWLALQLLHEYAPGLAPQPVSADLDATPPSVTMTVLSGEALGGQQLSAAELCAIGAALDRMHTCVPQQVLADVRIRAHSPREALGDTAGRLAAQPRPGDDAVISRAYDEALRWLAEAEANQLLSAAPRRAVLARADHNLTNFLWDGDQVRLVDFEYAGRSDRCDEMAELVEHISARCTPDNLWRQFLGDLDLSRDERSRLLTSRRVLAAMWFFMLLPGQEGARRNPPGTLRMQAQRTLELLGA